MDYVKHLLNVCFLPDGYVCDLYGGHWLSPSMLLIRKGQHYHKLEGLFTMRKNGSKKPTGVNADFMFVNDNLTTREKEQFKQWWSDHNPDFEQEVALLVAGGWKLSVAYDSDNNSFRASYTCNDVHSGNYNCCVTSRHSEWAVAVGLGLFKIAHLWKDRNFRQEAVHDDWG